MPKVFRPKGLNPAYRLKSWRSYELVVTQIVEGEEFKLSSITHSGRNFPKKIGQHDVIRRVRKKPTD